jgi:hypothetical protein
LEWVVGKHTLTAGIDNLKMEARNEGTEQVVDRWIYSVRNATAGCGNINAARDVGNPCLNPAAAGGGLYYVDKYTFWNNTSMTVDQKAYFVEDRWQITDNFLLSIGLRNDQFTNRNNAGAAYLNAKNQWAPRLGASWDVFGNSSLRLFANAGRYFLALPNSVAIRGALASQFTDQYFTYTGIDPVTGVPTGLTPVPSVLDPSKPSVATSANLEVGLPVDASSFAPTDLKNMYQDEISFGFEKTLGEQWAYGAKLTYRNLRSSTDDYCAGDEVALAAGMVDYDFDHFPTGIDWSRGKFVMLGPDGKRYEASGCYMFNPGGTSTYSFANYDDPSAPRYVGKVDSIKALERVMDFAG